MTKIEWTDETWNPVTGCRKVSEGCRFCYAERDFPRVYGKERKFTEVALHHDRMDKPLRWRRPRFVFVNSMSDLFHEDVPEDFIRDVFLVMSKARKHTFQVLTKRPERMAHLLMAWNRDGLTYREGWTRRGPPPNIWLGVSVENQKAADTRIPILLSTPGSVRFLSCEPLLGPVDLADIRNPRGRMDGEPAILHCNALTGFRATSAYSCVREPAIDWVIVGGESGPKARPMHPQWAKSLRDQCVQAKVPYFFKQWGEWVAPDQVDGGVDLDLLASARKVKAVLPDGRWVDRDAIIPEGAVVLTRPGKKAAGRLLDGKEWSDMPEDSS